MAMVCLCHGVNERRIRKEIDHGARSVEDVAQACRAGSCCLSCHATIDELLAEHVPATAVGVRRRLRFADVAAGGTRPRRDVRR